MNGLRVERGSSGDISKDVIQCFSMVQQAVFLTRYMGLAEESAVQT